MDGGFWNAIVLLLIGAIFGGLIQAFVHLYLVFDESKGIAMALRAEMDTILTLVKKREFVQQVDAIITRLQDPAHTLIPQDVFAIPIAQDYFSVFNSVSPKIGLLGDLSGPVVRFYSMCKSLIDEIDAFGKHRENIMKGITKLALIDRKFLLEEIQKMRAFYESMEQEGMQAIHGLDAHTDMGFWRWTYNRFCS